MNMAVITDEISRDFITATEVLSGLDIKTLELRTLRTGRVPYITEEEELELQKHIKEKHCMVHAISPAIAKLNIETPDLRKKTIKHLEDSIKFATKFSVGVESKKRERDLESVSSGIHPSTSTVVLVQLSSKK